MVIKYRKYYNLLDAIYELIDACDKGEITNMEDLLDELKDIVDNN